MIIKYGNTKSVIYYYLCLISATQDGENANQRRQHLDAIKKETLAALKSCIQPEFTYSMQSAMLMTHPGLGAATPVAAYTHPTYTSPHRRRSLSHSLRMPRRCCAYSLARGGAHLAVSWSSRWQGGRGTGPEWRSRQPAHRSETGKCHMSFFMQASRRLKLHLTGNYCGQEVYGWIKKVQSCPLFQV